MKNIIFKSVLTKIDGQPHKKNYTVIEKYSRLFKPATARMSQ